MILDGDQVKPCPVGALGQLDDPLSSVGRRGQEDAEFQIVAVVRHELIICHADELLYRLSAEPQV